MQWIYSVLIQDNHIKHDLLAVFCSSHYGNMVVFRYSWYHICILASFDCNIFSLTWLLSLQKHFTWCATWIECPFICNLQGHYSITILSYSMTENNRNVPQMDTLLHRNYHNSSALFRPWRDTSSSSSPAKDTREFVSFTGIMEFINNILV